MDDSEFLLLHLSQLSLENRALRDALNGALGPSAAALVYISVASRDKNLRFLFEILARFCGFRCAVAWRCVSRSWLRIVGDAHPATSLLPQVVVTGGWDGSARVFDQCFAALPFGLPADAIVDDETQSSSAAEAEALPPTLRWALSAAPPPPPQWSALPSMTVARWGHSALLTARGIVVIGGGDISDAPLASAEELTLGGRQSSDRSRSEWRMLPPMREGRIRFSAAVLRNGIIVVAGGWANKRYYRSAELYDPRTRTWAALPPMACERSATGTAVLNGELVVVGGWDGKKALDSVEVLTLPANGDVRGAQWTTLPPMSGKRWGCAAVALNGKLLVMGGMSEKQPQLADDELSTAHALDSVEEYDPALRQWRPLPSMGAHREALGASAVCGRVVVVGGSCHGCARRAAQLMESGSPAAAAPCAPCVEVLARGADGTWSWSDDVLPELPHIGATRLYGGACVN